MKTIINTIPGYRTNEYLVVLSPHEELWQRILKIKKEFAENYKAPTAVRGEAAPVIGEVSANRDDGGKDSEQAKDGEHGLSSFQS